MINGKFDGISKLPPNSELPVYQSRAIDLGQMVVASGKVKDKPEGVCMDNF
jgi:hypothetical protein